MTIKKRQNSGSISKVSRPNIKQQNQYYPPGSLQSLILVGAILLAGCGAENVDNEAEEMQPVIVQQVASEIGLVPLPGMEDSVPELTEKVTVLMKTGSGDLTIDIYPQAAPNAAARFLELVSAGFYDNTPVFRVVQDFVAQFGINWRDDYPAWQNNNFNDDPSLFALERGTLVFAKAGPNTNSTQVFINYTENNRLADPSYNFTVFGIVTDGMDAADNFITVGDPGGGLDQERLWNDGAAYLDSLETGPVMIEVVTIMLGPDSP